MTLSGLQKIHERLHTIDHQRSRSGLSDEASSGFPVNHKKIEHRTKLRSVLMEHEVGGMYSTIHLDDGIFVAYRKPT